MTQPKARARSGNYPLPHPTTGETVELYGVSTLKKQLYSFTLERWKQERVAATLAARPDLLLLAGNKATLRDATYQALNIDRAASNIGTAVHGYTESAEAGTLDMAIVPEGARPFLTEYLKAKRAHGFEAVYFEATVFNFEHNYAGTLDRIVNYPGLGLVVADIKTGGVYPETALQLAYYANAEGIYVPPEDEESGGRFEPMPEGLNRKVGLVFNLTDSKCPIIPVELEQAWEACKALVVVKRFQDKGRKVIGKPYTPKEVPSARIEPVVHSVSDLPPASNGSDNQRPGRPVADAWDRDSLVRHIQAMTAEAKQDLARNWPDGVPTFKASSEHAAEQLAAIKAVVVAVESVHKLPFLEPLREMTEPEAAAAVERAFTRAAVPADEEDRRALAARLNKLDAKTYKALQDKAVDAGIPNVGGARFTKDHAAALDALLRDIETGAVK